MEDFLDFLANNKVNVKVITTDSGSVCFYTNLWYWNWDLGEWTGALEYSDSLKNSMKGVMRQISGNKCKSSLESLEFIAPKFNLK